MGKEREEKRGRGGKNRGSRRREDSNGERGGGKKCGKLDVVAWVGATKVGHETRFPMILASRKSVQEAWKATNESKSI